MASLLFLILSTIVIRNGNAVHPIYGCPVRNGEFKYAAAIYKNGIFTCNGVIISTRYILTAGHCACNRTSAIFRVIVGEIRQTDAKTATWLEVGNTHCHYSFREFVPRIHINDIGLLKLKVPLVFDDNIQPIKLAIDTDRSRRVQCQFVIFRENEKYYKTSNSIHVMDLSLRWTPVTVTTHDECLNINDPLTNERCAIHSFHAESRIRPGDSGAATVCENKVLGIIVGTLFKNNFSVNGATILMVTPYLRWIASIVHS